MTSKSGLDDIAAPMHHVNVVRVGLHHGLALCDELFAIVGFAILIIRSVSELPIDDLVTVPQPCFDDAHRQRTKTVPSHLAGVAHATQHRENSAVAGGPVLIVPVGEKIFAAASCLIARP